MFLKQIPNDETGCLSYIGYCASCGVGYAIDPLQNIEPYLKIANDNNIQITHIFNTHIQADHISGDRKWPKKQEPRYTCTNLLMSPTFLSRLKKEVQYRLEIQELKFYIHPAI